MKHTISLVVENKLGTAARIIGLFSSRGFNLESISVGESEEKDLYRMTIVTRGEDAIIEQITKQLNKLVDVVKVTDLTLDDFIERELALIKVSSNSSTRMEIMQIADVFRAKIVDISPRTLTVEATGTEDKINAIISMLRPYGLKEIARTGHVALKREFRGET
ncbi:MAG: acetolactate synthase small subunit [Calditrichaeota bacterium]|nr:acetolactate synthase small subunit [Calditrichota bacterium]